LCIAIYSFRIQIIGLITQRPACLHFQRSTLSKPSAPFISQELRVVTDYNKLTNSNYDSQLSTLINLFYKGTHTIDSQLLTLNSEL